MKRRVIVISEDFVEPWDEGIKNFSWSLGRALKEDHEVRLINVDRSGVGSGVDTTRVPSSRLFAHPRLRRRITEFDPELIIYVPSPSSTLASFGRCFFLRRHAPRAAIGMVALIPRRHRWMAKAMVTSAAPDLLFVPSYRSLLHSYQLKLDSKLIPVGVDVDKFRLPGDGEKVALRRRFGISESKYVYLHVGHLSRKRNLEALAVLARRPGAELIVIGSTSTEEDVELRARLESLRIRVIREVVPISEFYRLADCYVFPVVDSDGCVEIPLSVLEALASGLPVLTRPFGGLRDHLPPGDDVRYWDNEDELCVHADSLRANGVTKVRAMDSFSWRNVATSIVSSLETRLKT